MEQRPLRIAGATLFVAVALVLVWWWRHLHPAERGSSSTQATTLGLVSNNLTDRNPQGDPDIFNAYAGSRACQNCHEEAYQSWQISHHGLAERPVQPDLDQASFDPPRTFAHGSQSSAVSWRDSTGFINANGLGSTNETYSVARVIGHDPLRQFLVAVGAGRFQAMETAYDPRSNSWFNVYGNEDRRPGEWGHWSGRGMNWNSMCASCHNTRLQKKYAPATDSYQTRMAEPTVSCEACHGPLKAHVVWQTRFGTSGQKDPTVPKWTLPQNLDTCGTCHARRADLTGDFVPGDDFFNHHQLTIVDHENHYYADGQVRDEDYEYGSFLSSRMHLRGIACQDCHNVHSGKTVLPGNWLCQRCHDGSNTNAPVINPVNHSHHQVFGYSSQGVVTNFDLMAYKPKEIKETGGECVNCHMPQTLYMQKHWRHDHGFTIPDPLLTKEFGIPNACNRCHQDKPTDWTLTHVEQWYGTKMERPSRTRARTLALAGQGDRSTVTNLIALLGNEPIAFWRASAASCLQSWAFEPAVLQALVKALQDTNALVRTAVINTIGPLLEQAPPELEAILAKSLNDPIRSVRVATALAMRSKIPLSSGAGKELVEMLSFNSDQPGGQMQLGGLYFARNELELAVQHLQKAAEWDRGSAPVRHELAVALSAAQRPLEARRELEAACRLAPTDAEMHYALALACNELGDISATIQSLEAALKLDSKHTRAWYNLGLAQSQAGQPEAALQSLLRAESLDSTDARIPYARATILARLNRTPEAVQAVQRALEIQPHFPEAEQLRNQLLK